MRQRTGIAAVAFALVLAGTGFAVEPAIAAVSADISYSDYYDDRSASNLLRGDVYDGEGTKIGAVNDVIVDADGNFVRLVVETKPMTDIDDSYYSVDWGAVTYDDAGGAVTINRTGSEIESIERRPSPDFAEEGQMRLGAALGTTVHTEGSRHWGRVSDMLFNVTTGRLTAYVLDPHDGQVSLFLLPYGDDGVSRGDDGYVIDAVADVFDDHEPFVYPEYRAG